MFVACPPYGIDYIASILIPADGRTRPPRFSLELRRSHVHAFTIQNKTHLSRNHSVVPDGVTGPETNPLRNRTVLLLGFGKLLLGAEGLLGLFFMISLAPHDHYNNPNKTWRYHRRDDNDSRGSRTGILMACRSVEILNSR